MEHLERPMHLDEKEKEFATRSVPAKLCTKREYLNLLSGITGTLHDELVKKGMTSEQIRKQYPEISQANLISMRVLPEWRED